MGRRPMESKWLNKDPKYEGSVIEMQGNRERTKCQNGICLAKETRKPFKLYILADDLLIGSALMHEFEGKERMAFYLSR